MTQEIKKYRTPYGPVWVKESDLNKWCKIIPMYTKDGIKLSDTPKGERMLRKGDCTCVHVENLLEELI
ncbi:MAG: hypothetical protein E6R04_06515 [Spirochaetes bacterium]|nr:MAG: hypothetical protein E6R04_06515 [Spirochaetota bacterium]